MENCFLSECSVLLSLLCFLSRVPSGFFLEADLLASGVVGRDDVTLFSSSEISERVRFGIALLSFGVTNGTMLAFSF